MIFKLEDHFAGGLSPLWEVTEAGRASVRPTPGGLRMAIQHAQGAYSNAQIADYSYRDFHFRWRPPVRLTIVARAEGDPPSGTAGFGFWNHPFSPDAHRLPRLPQAIWFFYAGEQSDMALAYGVPGCGWKAATLTTGQWPGLVLAPGALAAILLTRIPGLGRPVMNLARRFVIAHEAPLADVALDQWHTYGIDWQPAEARFSVDGVERLRSPAPGAGPLGFVMWVDNQYAIASEDGHFGFGLSPVGEAQWLEIKDLQLGV